jgi:hypothetical protein
VRSNAPGTLRFMCEASGVDPWSPSNAVAQFPVLLGVPVEVLQGKYGPGLAALYQPCALLVTFGAVSVRGELSNGFAQTRCASPHASVKGPDELVPHPFLMCTPAVSYVIVFPCFCPIDAGLLIAAVPQTWSSFVIAVLLLTQRFPWMYNGESKVVLLELLKSHPVGSPVPYTKT